MIRTIDDGQNGTIDDEQNCNQELRSIKYLKRNKIS